MDKKTWWPYGILLIIIVGIILLIGLVYASLQQPNLDEESYMQSYESVEKNINDFIDSTHLFMKAYGIKFYANNQPITLISPYLQKKQDKKNQPPTLKLHDDNLFVLDFVPKNTSLTKIKEYKFYTMYYHHKDVNNHSPFFTSKNLRQTFSFKPLQTGRIKLILEIIFTHQNIEKTIFLQYDFIVKD